MVTGCLLESWGQSMHHPEFFLVWGHAKCTAAKQGRPSCMSQPLRHSPLALGRSAWPQHGGSRSMVAAFQHPIAAHTDCGELHTIDAVMEAAYTHDGIMQQVSMGLRVLLRRAPQVPPSLHTSHRASAALARRTHTSRRNTQ